MPSNTKPKKRVVRLKKRRSFWSRTSTASRLAIGFLILCQFCLSYMCFQLYTQIATLRQSQLQMQRAPSCDTVTTNISPLLSKLTDDYDLGRVLIHEVTTYTNKSHIPKVNHCFFCLFVFFTVAFFFCSFMLLVINLLNGYVIEFILMVNMKVIF